MSRRIELMYLPGLGDVVRDEVADHGFGRVHEVPGRDDSVWFDHAGSLRPLLRLSTVVAPFAVLTFPVPRPKSLTSSEHLPAISQAVQLVRKLDGAATTFTFDAPGPDSPGFARLATELARISGLTHDRDRGDVMLRFRRSVCARDGWDVLVRLCTRPLSDRDWRVCDFPGAANATVARAMARLTGPRPRDRVANLMCGSGTLLIERLLDSPARTTVGVDNDPVAMAACAENLDAAGLTGRVQLYPQDIGDGEWAAQGPFDVILADPPWGDLVCEHDGNEQLHLTLLRRAHDAAAPGARLVVLTHEIRQMDRCLRATGELWTPVSETRVFHKGHHPRIYLLRRTK